MRPLLLLFLSVLIASTASAQIPPQVIRTAMTTNLVNGLPANGQSPVYSTADNKWHFAAGGSGGTATNAYVIAAGSGISINTNTGTFLFTVSAGDNLTNWLKLSTNLFLRKADDTATNLTVNLSAVNGLTMKLPGSANTYTFVSKNLDRVSLTNTIYQDWVDFNNGIQIGFGAVRAWEANSVSGDMDWRGVATGDISGSTNLPAGGIQLSAASLVGRSSAGAGQQITVGSGLTLSGTTLTASGGTQVYSNQTISTTSPLTGGGDLSVSRTFAINDAGADGATKGAATFTAADFNAASGLVSIDYANGQAASAGAKGFLTASDWSTFNGKQASGNYITALTGDGTASGPGSAALTLATVATPGSAAKVTYNAKGLVTSGTTLVVADLPTGIPNANLANSTITINGVPVALGGTVTGLGNFSTNATTAAANVFGPLTSTDSTVLSGVSSKVAAQIVGGLNTNIMEFKDSNLLPVGFIAANGQFMWSNSLAIATTLLVGSNWAGSGAGAQPYLTNQFQVATPYSLERFSVRTNGDTAVLGNLMVGTNSPGSNNINFALPGKADAWGLQGITTAGSGSNYVNVPMFTRNITNAGTVNTAQILATNLTAITTTSDNAAAGFLGEFANSLVASGSAVSLSTGTAANITTISLTAGDWDVEGNVNFGGTSATVTQVSGGITTTSATVPTDGSEVFSDSAITAFTATDSITLPRKRISIAGTTTVYLVGKATFSLGTVGGFGQINARRVR